MKATARMTLDTTWGNQLILGVECELDNPHTLTTRELSSLMVGTLRIMAEEARSENEREVIGRAKQTQEHEESPQHGESERERERFLELSRQQDPRRKEEETP